LIDKYFNPVFNNPVVAFAICDYFTTGYQEKIVTFNVLVLWSNIFSKDIYSRATSIFRNVCNSRDICNSRWAANV
jgi:hypothetical protein